MLDKKKKKLGGAAMVGIASALLAAACKGENKDFSPASNATSTLYGPPYTNSEDYDPSVNMNGEVYGPPEDMIGNGTGGITFEQVPSDDINKQDLSGNLQAAPDTEDGEGFKPADNIAEPVYGPPAGSDEATE